MNIAIVDISRKVPLYDFALCKSLYESLSAEDSMWFVSPKGINEPQKWEHHFNSILPLSLKSKQNIIRRVLKGLEVFYNYFELKKFIRKKAIDILHLEWLPMLEVNEYEIKVLKAIKKNKRTKIVLTVHNLYPHNTSKRNRIIYNHRFKKACSYIDHFIVHTELSKRQLCAEYALPSDKVSVIYHGIFESSAVEPYTEKAEKYKIIMFGTQSYYKGTDLLIKAYHSLSQEDKEKSCCVIMGATPSVFYEELKEFVEESNIRWTTFFVEESALDREISTSDLIVIPYREITQSGVLLKALSFNKPILTSDLPAFKETLIGFSEDSFFRNGDIQALSSSLHSYINHLYNTDGNLKQLKHLRELYSWDASAKNTLYLYKELLK